MIHVNYVVHRYKHLIPFWKLVFSPLCRLCFGLYEFLWGTGWLKSIWQGRAVNKRGEYIPWLAWPIVELLENTNLEGKYILEFGGGTSTLFWLRKGCKVYCYEKDQSWRKWIESKATNEQLGRLTFNEGNYERIRFHMFDIILVDDNPMYNYIREITSFGMKHQAIIVDNIEIPQSERKEGDLLALLREYYRVDFCGFSAGNATQQCTSLFCPDIVAYDRLFGGRGTPVLTLSSQEFRKPS